MTRTKTQKLRAALARTVAIPVPLRKPASQRRRRRARALVPVPVNDFALRYAKTIIDPWEFGPMRVGFGTLSTTSLGVAYWRGTIAVNATDGSFGLMLLPDCENMVQICTAGGGTATWTSQPASNQAVLAGQMQAARVVSGGLRVMPLQASTVAPGVLYAGALPGSTKSQVNAMIITNINNLASSEVGIAGRGARVVTLPEDPNSYALSYNVLNGYASTTVVGSTIPYICGTGYAGGTNILVEAVLNLEGSPNVGNLSAYAGVNPDDIDTSGPEAFTNLETLAGFVKKAVGSDVVMDAVEGLATLSHPILGQSVRVARSAFGGGTSYRRGRDTPPFIVNSVDPELEIIGASASATSAQQTRMLQRLHP